MKYKSAARVYLVSRPAVDWEQIAAFLSDEELPPIPDSIRAGTDDSNAIIEVSARLCYMSFGRGRRDISDFIHNLLSSKDGSVFEHVNYGFVFTGVSRSLTHELVRHRAGFAYSQRSQRYVDETEGSFVLPPALTGEDGDADEARGILKDAMESASESYVKLVGELESVLPRKAIRAQYRPSESDPPGGARGAAQRDRDQDIRHRQRQGLAAFHRDARRAIRRLGDTVARAPGTQHPSARGAHHVRRLRGLGPTGRHPDRRA